MKIAVIGLYNDSNLGDRIICECVAEWMRGAYASARIDIIDITGNEEFGNQKQIDMKQLYLEQYKRRWRELRARMKGNDDIYEWCSMLVGEKAAYFDQIASENYDIAVFAGGQLFMDTLALYVCAWIERFHKTGTLVFCNACGFGFMRSSRIADSLKEHLCYDNVRWISSRELVEEDHLFYKDLGNKIRTTFDPALWSADVYGVDAQNSGKIGLGVMYCQNISLKKQVAFWLEVISELKRRQIPWIVFCNGAAEDFALGRHILKKANLDAAQYQYPCAVRSIDLVKQIASIRGIISFRLHSHVLAASLGKPAVAITWDEKLNAFYRHMGHPERCMTMNHDVKDIVDMICITMDNWKEKDLVDIQKNAARNNLLKVIEKEINHEQRRTIS